MDVIIVVLVVLYLWGAVKAHLGAAKFVENNGGYTKSEDYIAVYFVAPLLSWLAVCINEEES